MAGLDHPVRQVFDSNCITPGTEFMAEISKHLRYFIRKKIREDTMWQRLHVILSGHEVCEIGVVAVVAIAAVVRGAIGRVVEYVCVLLREELVRVLVRERVCVCVRVRVPARVLVRACACACAPCGRCLVRGSTRSWTSSGR